QREEKSFPLSKGGLRGIFKRNIIMRNAIEVILKPPLRPNLCVESRWPILKIAYYYRGCPPRSALILNLIVEDPGL
ncbi:MAG: hypothetical protein MUO68_22245, partial [Desulfobacteraceae bacterium]|nr:hypothetical protein [Desulfobacteraceae bacterium]